MHIRHTTSGCVQPVLTEEDRILLADREESAAQEERKRNRNCDKITPRQKKSTHECLQSVYPHFTKVFPDPNRAQPWNRHNHRATFETRLSVAQSHALGVKWIAMN